MRARIRTIKPEAHTDEDLWDLEQDTGLPMFRAYTGLWNHADREGRFEWRARPLKAGILPYWDGDFSRVLDALASRGLVVRYTVDGREYGVIPSFTKHQTINNKEEASRIPPPPEKEAFPPEESRVNHASPTREPREPDAPLSDSRGTEGNGRERKGTEPKGASASRDQSKIKLSGLDQALEVEPQARAIAMLAAWHTADFVEPHRWPEVHEALGAFATALGWITPRIPTAANAKRAVELLAAYTVDELKRAATAAPADKWLTEPGMGPSCLTVEVVGRLLNSVGKPPAVPKGPPRTGEDIALERRLERQRREIHEMMAAEAERKAQEAAGA